MNEVQQTKPIAISTGKRGRPAKAQTIDLPTAKVKKQKEPVSYVKEWNFKLVFGNIEIPAEAVIPLHKALDDLLKQK